MKNKFASLVDFWRTINPEKINYLKNFWAYSGEKYLRKHYIYCTNYFGLNTILKTLMGFVIVLFRSEQGDNLRLTPVQAFVGALVIAIVHNGLMTIIVALDQGTRTPFLIFGLWLGASLYTAVVALAGALFRSRG